MNSVLSSTVILYFLLLFLLIYVQEAVTFVLWNLLECYCVQKKKGKKVETVETSNVKKKKLEIEENIFNP